MAHKSRCVAVWKRSSSCGLVMLPPYVLMDYRGYGLEAATRSSASATSSRDLPRVQSARDLIPLTPSAEQSSARICNRDRRADRLAYTSHPNESTATERIGSLRRLPTSST